MNPQSLPNDRETLLRMKLAAQISATPLAVLREILLIESKKRSITLVESLDRQSLAESGESLTNMQRLAIVYTYTGLIAALDGLMRNHEAQLRALLTSALTTHSLTDGGPAAMVQELLDDLQETNNQ